MYTVDSHHPAYRHHTAVSIVGSAEDIPGSAGDSPEQGTAQGSPVETDRDTLRDTAAAASHLRTYEGCTSILAVACERYHRE